MKTPEPLLSIITVNLNNREGLERTLESVASQTCRDFEYVVVDGGSTDGSRELIESRAGMIDRWVSEPDRGVYAAMNKGVRMAREKYVLFLNSGDSLFDSRTIEKILPALEGDATVVAGDVYNWGDGVEGKISRSPKKITLPFLVFFTVNHQACFIRRDRLEDRPYDEGLRIVSDWKFFLQEHLDGRLNYRKVPVVVSRYNTDGLSARNMDALVDERKQTLAELGVDVYDLCSNVPYELIEGFNSLPSNYRFSRLISKIDLAIMRLYRRFKR